MPKLIPGSGNPHPRLFICGERPGGEEHAAGRGFVGPAGDELWARLWRVCKLERDDCWVDNLVKTFSLDPPSAKEIARDAPHLRRALHRIKPAVILTVGYHAARWFLPEFADWPGDYFHGLAFTTMRCPGAIVVPACHSAAALRQPDRYQSQFTTDLEALRAVLRTRARGDAVECHRAAAATPYPVGLASVGHASVTGLDTEGTPDDPQAVSLSDGTRNEACCVDFTTGTTPSTRASTSTSTAPLKQVLDGLTVAIHHAKYDWRVLAQLGVHLTPARVHDSMLQAYLLGLPQSLKVLAYRTQHCVMTEYEELVMPVDDARVRVVLEAAHAKAETAAAEAQSLVDTRRRAAGLARRRARTATRAARRGHLHDATARFIRERAAKAARAYADAKAAASAPTAEGQFPKRGRSALARILKTAEGHASEKALRTRWGKSKFHGLVPLPPPSTWRDVPTSQRIPYAQTDALMHHAIHTTLWPQVIASGQSRVYRIDRGVLPFLARNETIGLKVDTAQLAALSKQFALDYADVCAKINALAGREVNPLASEDISDTIFSDWGVTPTRKTKTGFFTTQDKYLKARKDQHAGIPLVIEARQINKMRGTYVDRLPALLREHRYHPDWKYTRTSSGRAAEQIILLIPKHTARGRAVRRCFVADDGCELVSADLSQIELRSFAHLTQEPKMLKALREGIDLHTLTAYEMLGAPRRKADQDESLHRLPAKTFNFSMLMGATPYGILDQLHEQGQLQWTLDEVDVFWHEWFQKYPVAAAWVEAQKQYARRHGYVRTREGRIIRLSGVWSTNDKIAAEFERKAHAIPVQEDAANIAKRWIARIWNQIIAPMKDVYHCEPWVWVHDDVTLCVDQRYAKKIGEFMLQLVPQDLSVPVTAEVKTGRNWAPYDKKHPKLNPGGLR